MVDATPETIAKVHPMNASESNASAMTAANTIDLDETELPLRVSSSDLSPLKSAVRMGTSPTLIEIMFRATSSRMVTKLGR